MQNETDATKEIVSVAEMARMCRLSRSRFYSLVQEGIMPQPLRNAQTQRPFYNREQQVQCLSVRRTNCGINGKPILFYAARIERHPVERSEAPKRRTSPRPTLRVVDPLVDELKAGLSQLGMSDVADVTIRAALADLFPDGPNGMPTAMVLMSVFRRLQSQNSRDNAAG